MIDLEEVVLKDFDSIHKFSNFDGLCLKGSVVSDLFVDLFLKGPNYLFESLKDSFPLTYGALVGCKDLWLLERKRLGSSGSGFTLVIVFDDYFISAKMLNKGLIARRTKTGLILPDSMTVLSRDFHGFYHCFDGLSMPKNYSAVGLKNYDLPGALGCWDEVLKHCDNYDIKMTADFVRNIKLFNNQLLVWIDRGDGNMFLIEDSTSGNRIFSVNLKESSEIVCLDEPVKVIDSYCESVILRKGLNS